MVAEFLRRKGSYRSYSLRQYAGDIEIDLKCARGLMSGERTVTPLLISQVGPKIGLSRMAVAKSMNDLIQDWKANQREKNNARRKDNEIPGVKTTLWVQDILIDIPENWLVISNVPIRITPTALKVLMVLVVNEGSVVIKQDLIEQIWGSREISRLTLPNHIKVVRYLLQPFAYRIRSVPLTGYAFERVNCFLEKTPKVKKLR